MEEYLIFIPYLASGAQGNEINYAIAGWRKHFKENYHIVIVGDHNPIFDHKKDITFINCPRIECEDSTKYRPAMDVMNKLKVFREHYPNINGFIWVADDCYAVNDFDISDIKFLKMLEPDFTFDENSNNGWKREKMKTKKLLKRSGNPTRNFSIHLPRWYECDKLDTLIKKYDLYNSGLILEDLYFNIFYKDRIPFQLNKDTDNIKFGVYTADVSCEDLKKAFKTKIWITNSPVGWIPELDKQLKQYYG